MEVHGVTPILNVSDLRASFDWFAKFGWAKGWEWCPPDAEKPTFGAVALGEYEIFLCLDGQGGRGEHGAWMSLWVDDVDAIRATCAKEGLEVISAPEDKPWGVREMHVRHPDGHVFRVSAESAHEHPHD
jgi:uncharacterized glyoxalase superfamily protein PhnB